jgi:hypothetical protein
MSGSHPWIWGPIEGMQGLRLPPPPAPQRPPGGYAPDPIPNFTKGKIRIENQRAFSVFLFPTLKVDCLESQRIARWHYCP